MTNISALNLKCQREDVITAHQINACSNHCIVYDSKFQFEINTRNSVSSVMLKPSTSNSINLIRQEVLRCKLKSVVARIIPPTSNIVTQQNFVVALVEKSRRQFNLVLQHATSTCNNKFCCVTMFEVGGNTDVQQRFSICNATMLRCKLQQFVARITSP